MWESSSELSEESDEDRDESIVWSLHLRRHLHPLLLLRLRLLQTVRVPSLTLSVASIQRRNLLVRVRLIPSPPHSHCRLHPRSMIAFNRVVGEIRKTPSSIQCDWHWALKIAPLATNAAHQEIKCIKRAFRRKEKTGIREKL